MTARREVWVKENGLSEPLQSALDPKRIKARPGTSERVVRYVPELYEQAAKEAQARVIELQGEPAVLAAQVMQLTEEREEAREWVRKLTSTERVLTCVYCGHAYPPGTPEHGAEVLTAHVAVCEKHPMQAMRDKLDGFRVLLRQASHMADGVGAAEQAKTYRDVERELTEIFFAPADATSGAG